MIDITFVSETTGQNKTLKRDQVLGEGLSGSVATLIDNNNKESGLVCKTILLGTNGAKKIKLMRALNELRFLRKLKLLEGFQRNGDEIYIIIKKLHGTVAAQWTDLTDEHLPLFVKELRNIHRKNIYHSDPHLRNFIVSDPTNNPKPHLIDFDRSNDATYLGVALDICLMWFAINYQRPVLLFSLKNCLKYYVQEMLEHANNHRYETCQQVLLMGALTLSAIYVIPALGITHLLVREFITALIWNRFGKECMGFFDILHSITLNQNQIRVYKIAAEVINVLTLTLGCYISYSQVAYHLTQGSTQGGRILMNAIKDQSWQSIFANVTPEVLTHTALLYYPIEQLLNRLNKFTSSTFMPESVLKGKVDLLYKHHPKFYATQMWSNVNKKVTGNNQEANHHRLGQGV